jgi:hypothetical protein
MFISIGISRIMLRRFWTRLSVVKTSATRSCGSSILEHSVVALRHPVECKGGVLPEGGKGTVVHVYRDSEHYEVEFAEPFPCTVTLRRDDIHPE